MSVKSLVSNSGWLVLAKLMLILSIVSLVGCTKKIVTNIDSVPPYPSTEFEFVSYKDSTNQKELNCLDNDNTNKFVMWLLEIERYSEAVETLRTR